MTHRHHLHYEVHSKAQHAEQKNDREALQAPRTSSNAKNDETLFLDKILSDHTYQSIKVTYRIKNSDSFTISGSTWNLMNQCYQKGDPLPFKPSVRATYPNNPFGYSETHAEFLARLERQIKKLDEISEGQDFIFLQEVDFLKHKKNKQVFVRHLEEKNWGLLFTEKPKLGQPFQQPLATLYNKKTLRPKLESSCGVFPISGRGQYRGYECQFEVLESRGQSIIKLVNVHLHFNENYAKTIPGYLLQQVKYGFPTIMGGDMNHPPSREEQDALLLSGYATNVSLNNQGEMTDTHGNTACKKHYDRFFVSTTHAVTAQLTEGDGEYMALSQDGSVSARPLNRVAVSLNPEGHHLEESSLWPFQVEVDKENIKKKLLGYISRIDSYRGTDRSINFEYGFWFFKKSRGVNRKANYLLAQNLLMAIKKYEKIDFNDQEIQKRRLQFFSRAEEKKMSRGINSAELNHILKQAKKLKK